MISHPDHVNAQIASIKERHPRYWSVPEALAEAVSIWGSGANEHGVFCRHERIEIAKTPHAHAAVLIAESGNGLFGCGIEYGFQMGGGGGFPSVWREAFGSRDEARAAAVADLIEHLGRGGDKRQAELLRRLKREGQQRLLFE
jgi:hypothetical protein